MGTIETLKTTNRLPQLTREQEQEIFSVLHNGRIQSLADFDNNQFISGSKIIEICGIPSIGKTTAIFNSQQTFSALGYPFSIFDQPNPKKLKDIGLSDYNIMIILKTFEKILQNSVSKKASNIDWIYDRGGLGQIPFIQIYDGSETNPQETAVDINFLYNHLGFRFDALIIVNPNPNEFKFTKLNYLSQDLLFKLYLNYKNLPEVITKLNQLFLANLKEYYAPPLIIGYTEAVTQPEDVTDLLPKILGSLFRF